MQAKVKFLRDYLVKNAEATAYKKGQVVEMSFPSASHFIRRNAAVLITDALDETETPSVVKRGRPRRAVDD